MNWQRLRAGIQCFILASGISCAHPVPADYRIFGEMQNGNIYDYSTGQTIDKVPGGYVNPSTGAIYNRSQNGIYDPQSGVYYGRQKDGAYIGTDGSRIQPFQGGAIFNDFR